MAKEKYAVLLADETESDSRLMQLAFRRVSRMELVGVVKDGGQAIAYLAGTGIYSSRQQFPFPDLLLLDLMMSIKDGFEVLEWLRQQSLPRPKVVVLSGSSNPSEMQKAIDLGAQFYYEKRTDFTELVEFLKSMEEYMMGNH